MELRARVVALAVSAAASLVYLLAAQRLSFPADVVVKGVPVAVLGLIAWRERQPFLAVALWLSALGDVLLELGPSRFLLGLAAFLTAHLVYIILFVKHRRRTAAPAGQWAFPALLAVYGLVLAVWLAPALEDRRAAVFCYIAALIAMVATASRANYRSRWVTAGAVLFLISDSLVGTQHFKTPIPWGGFAVWITYYLGQCGIALGVLSEPRQPMARRAPAAI